ncbi:hypothetical protein TSAR_010898 [Trichomalopsis sarcophagae]|uniref:Vacuolar protein sorting-associated protein 72 homolog n=1 Tax=Trichomalopsis sarcophagae TaxID=543379 RepID=A0A232F2C7_9HYME|nr:hypothetical protein TSAR_010898 [Trichomalopsis sarcophagae]
MATSRPKRANAGNKMAKLLNEEEEDEFYKTTYGGFEETEQDNDYKEEVEAEDEVDSDFSIDENDEPVSDHEPEEKKRKKGVFTKAYKEPAKPSSSKPKEAAAPKRKRCRIQKIERIFIDTERKSIRHSTAVKSAATLKRLEKRNEDQRKKVKIVKYDDYKPTQDELLEEALQTEEINLKSLEKYQRLENEKKNTRTVRKTNVGPMIRYQSLSMPVMVLSNSHKEKASKSQTDTDADESKADDSENKSTEANDNGGEEKKEMNITDKEKSFDCIGTNGNYERTFVTFDNVQQFGKIFKKKPVLRPTLKSLCAITSRLPAKYRDPMTQLPYRNVQTFRLLRDAYYQQLDAQSDTSDPMISPELARWLEWRQKNNQISQRSTVRLEPASASSTS